VVGGVVILLTGACLITWASAQLAPASSTPGRAAAGIIAALGAALLWGTMYVPYRKSYISGMNPLSFVAIFTVGELVTALALACVFGGGPREVYAQLSAARPVLFWLFLGGFCWVLGDLFQQYATKYVGIARGIPLSNTNQLWGLAWGVLVFGELQDMGTAGQAMIVAGSVLMACGALAISLAAAPEQELHAWEVAVDRECERYGLSRDRVRAAMRGEDPLAATHGTRHWWEWLIAATAVGIAVWLAAAVSPLAVPVSLTWMATLATVTLAILMGSGWLLWRRTRFS
jgi:drug/metabolite transporter (DMT)-like permease